MGFRLPLTGQPAICRRNNSNFRGIILATVTLQQRQGYALPLPIKSSTERTCKQSCARRYYHDAQDIGRISDIVFRPMARREAAVIGVGRFLGTGQKNVAIKYGLHARGQ